MRESVRRGGLVLTALLVVGCHIVTLGDKELVDDGGGAGAVGGGGSGAAGGAVGGTAGTGGAVGRQGGGPACASPADCPGADTDCRVRTCVDDTCGVEDIAAGTSCDDDDGALCDGLGACVECFEHTHCDAAEYCDDTSATCATDVAQGDACTLDAMCPSGHCVDGVCCDVACDGGCEACAAALTGGADGTCDFVTRDTDPDGECAANGACNGCGTCEGGQFVDSLVFGDASHDVVAGIMIDGGDRILLGGSFEIDLDLGGAAPLASAGGYDPFAAVLSPTGAHVWSNSYGTATINQFARKLVTDSLGNLILAGHFTGQINFGGTTLDAGASSDVYVAKFASNGTHIWSKSFGSTGIQELWEVEVDGTEIIVSGRYLNDLDFGTPLPTAAGFQTFVARLDANGDEVWAKAFTTSSGTNHNRGLAIDVTGDVYVAGYHQGTTDFGDSVGVTSDVGTDGYVAKLAKANGNLVWKQVTAGTGVQAGIDVAVDSTGATIWMGYLEGPTMIGGGATIDTAGARDMFVAKLDAAGDHVWSQTFGDGADQLPGVVPQAAVVVDGNDNIVIAGSTMGTVDFGGCALPASGEDVFVLGLDAAGVHLFSRMFGDASVEQPTDLAVKSSGEIVVVGIFEDDIDFGGGAHTSAGGYDIFVTRLSP